MAELAPEGSQLDARQHDAEMNELHGTDGQENFTSYDEVYASFDAMGLKEKLLRGINAPGFEKPSVIQQRVIDPFCKGIDVIQQAQSGKGKTATFCSGILQQLDYSLVECQALVLSPTRELAQQIEKDVRVLGDYPGVKVHNCVGGTSVHEDQRNLSSEVHIVVGTPDRVIDMLRGQSWRRDYIRMFVLDEAYEMMLSRGFKDRIYDIFQLLPSKIQVGVFYAYGFEKPSAIQQSAMVPFCKGIDVIQQAQSESGKTATICSGILQQLDYSLVECQALVLAPTRELAQQLEKDMRALGDYLGVKVHACVGGTSVHEDKRILSGGVHVVVGTPGRVIDMLRRKSWCRDYIRMLVLDEAYELMLSRGFKDQINDIFQLLPSKMHVGGFYSYGCEKPSAIQKRGIIPFCKGIDVIQQALSGTEKTAMFCSGILRQLDYSLVECQALVLAPTRKLARQIEKVMQALGDYLGVKVHACVGGTSVREQQHILSNGVHVVVGTPRRVFDMLRGQSLRPNYITMFVLDEACETMLSRGLKDQICDIFQLLPSNIQLGVLKLPVVESY
ncbi:putative eukaryotic initiation factor 4A-2 [Gastrolobium bilobum]|uniref:putative eukaryotic initiation factor 4A-2 n=1 Tax=Gastrolobium bilobum TaxID=150636 RepID=UPI002AAF6962|nr:putative eukaryotic initiation factor 4A-2 [Gastrolobium bilobum]